ncbi:esterase/lipase family protein [Fusobacterium canifelinum]|uniref:Lipase n=1 Tax=Fusobacterium canifelinum TaxID=285729 RepID=A0ABX7CCH7_9FUSO|nr:lipase [Fusobacterium canifelinum]QQS87235.1 lipase [Fusobacterium canifelinum]
MKKIFKILFFIILLSILILWLVKIFLLTHKYQVKYYNEDKIEKDIVITFNGIYGYEKQLRFIDEKLAEDGYTVVNIQYPTVNDNIVEMTEKYIVPNIEEQVKKLNEINLERKAKNLPELKIHFVVHSMGTCLLRYYLKENKLDSLGKVVFITPPSHGSQLSDNPIADLIPYFIGPAVKDMKTNENSFVNQLGNPNYPCYILIGDSSNNFLFSMFIKGEDDGMIPLATAGLEGASLKTIKNTTHTSILENQETVDEILKFLKD